MLKIILPHSRPVHILCKDSQNFIIFAQLYNITVNEYVRKYFQIDYFRRVAWPRCGRCDRRYACGRTCGYGVRATRTRRKPGQSALVTQRREEDCVEILSGVFEGVTTGTPIGFVVYNSNMRSGDYDNLRNIFRPSHADFTYFEKYGRRDHRGGGRSSARETVSRCVGGAFAKVALRSLGVRLMPIRRRWGI